MIDEKTMIKTLGSKMRYLFITRDITIFEKQKLELEKLHKEIKETKEKFISEQNEDESNKFLSLENLCLAILSGIAMFIKIKQNDPNGAWSDLIEAQNNTYWSNNHYELSGNLQRECIIHFNNIEKILFPPQTFVSMSMASVKSKCSICDEDFTICEHIRGEAYMGVSCTEICTEFKDIHHVAIVDHPDDKRCRHGSYGDSKENMIDIMTLLPEKKS